MSHNTGEGLEADDRKASASVAVRFLLREVPFGVFLGASSLIALFLGKQIWSWYFSFFR
jgi:prepilin signal peptidase PulO-like enzyme (type II secretory pathway)